MGSKISVSCPTKSTLWVLPAGRAGSAQPTLVSPMEDYRLPYYLLMQLKGCNRDKTLGYAWVVTIDATTQ